MEGRKAGQKREEREKKKEGMYCVQKCKTTTRRVKYKQGKSSLKFITTFLTIILFELSWNKTAGENFAGVF